MPDFSDKAIAAWSSKLPEDVLQALQVPGEISSEGSGALIRALDSAQSSEVAEIVQQHMDDAVAFGRMRRIRLLAWMADQPDRLAVFKKFEEEEASGEKESGQSSAGILFLEDIRAYLQALSPRVARQIASDATVGAVWDAATSVENDLIFSQGGV